MLLKCLVFLFVTNYIEAEWSIYDRHRPCSAPVLANGKVKIRQRGRLVRFTCNYRYELVGNSYARCSNGRWDTPVPICVRPGCDVAPQPSNSIQIKEHRDAWVRTICHPGYQLVGSPVVYCNGAHWNDTAPHCITSHESPKLSCDFEEPDLCGWVQDEFHDFDWERWNEKTPSAFQNTGPSYDHTLGEGQTGYYMYVESTTKAENNTARLLSPSYDAALAVNGCFSFFYHMFGSSVGGLRVYQKPDSVSMLDLLLGGFSSQSPYLLFKQWGEQGDQWYSAAPQLNNVGEDFQIIIEGIRGSSYTSDIAIDDVAILQGENCTNFRIAGTTPSPRPVGDPGSCVGRCGVAVKMASFCTCVEFCWEDGTCCLDYFDLCLGDIFNTTPNSPVTQKLIGVSSTTDSITTSTTSTVTSTTSTTTSTTSTTTQKPITTTIKPITTQKLTTTTQKPTTQNPTTTLNPTTTQKLTTSQKSTTHKVTLIPKTTIQTTQKTAATTTLKPTTKKSNTTTTSDVNEEKEKQQKESDLNKAATSAPSTFKPKPSSWKTPVISVIVIVLCATLAYFVAVKARSARGRAALARLRGRSEEHSEVRYLASDNDL